MFKTLDILLLPSSLLRNAILNCFVGALQEFINRYIDVFSITTYYFLSLCHLKVLFKCIKILIDPWFTTSLAILRLITLNT